MAGIGLSVSHASVPEGWIRYQSGDYPAALAEYRSSYAADARNLDALYGMVNSLALLHRYAEAASLCDRLDSLQAPAEVVQKKREWIRGIHSLNHQFGASLDGGPLFYSSAFIAEPQLHYAYGPSRFGDGEAWFTLNQRHTFSLSVSSFRAAFKPDTVWQEVAYSDTLYRSLGQAPRTDHYFQGDFVNTLGQADVWYSDYTVPVRAPPAARQDQVRAGWSGAFPKSAFVAGLTLGESNLRGQKRLVDLFLRQTRFLPWLNLGLSENIQNLDHTLLLQLAPALARAYEGLLLTIEPTGIYRARRDPLVEIPDWQFSGAARLDYAWRILTASLTGAWGPRAFVSSEDGRIISSITLPHRQSYAIGAGVKPFGNPYLKIYGLYKWESYAQMNRQIAMTGVACQW